MSANADDRLNKRYAPWNAFDPPADLPEDLKVIYRLAANPVMIGVSFCSFPERFDYSTEAFSKWAVPLKEACEQLCRWGHEHEAEWRAKAPDVLSAVQHVLGEVLPLQSALSSLLVSLDPVAADLSDAQLVRMVNALRENSARNHLALAHAELDGISVSRACLDGLRGPLSVWANTRKMADGGPAEKKQAQPADVDAAEQFVTLDQMAALVNRNKKTLERLANAPESDMPAPDVEGGGGRPHEWNWSRIRPWLEKQFNRQLPALFPR